MKSVLCALTTILCLCALVGCIPDKRPPNRIGTVKKVNDFLFEYTSTKLGARPLDGIKLYNESIVPRGSSEYPFVPRCDLVISDCQDIPLKKHFRYMDRAVLKYDRVEKKLVSVFLYKLFDEKMDDEDVGREATVINDFVHQEYKFDVDEQGRRAQIGQTFGISMHDQSGSLTLNGKTRSYVGLEIYDIELTDQIYRRHSRPIYR